MILKASVSTKAILVSVEIRRDILGISKYGNPVLSPSLPHLQGAMFLPRKYFGSPSVVFPDRMHTGQLLSFLGESPAIFTNKLKSQNGDSER